MSTRPTFTVKGRLEGMGREVECLVMGFKVFLANGKEHPFPKLSIHNEPKDLPDGVYEVSFEGKTQPMRRKGNFWITL